MWEDPIVAEVHRTREMLAAKFDFDIDAIIADIQDRLVSPKTRSEVTAEGDRRDSECPDCKSSEDAPSA